jgi:hypothetical protein
MTKEQAQAIALNAHDIARWAGQQAADLDPLIVASDFRPLSPAETKVVLRGVRELYVRLSQQQDFLVVMGFHRGAPWRMWIRAWLWGWLKK